MGSRADAVKAPASRRRASPPVATRRATFSRFSVRVPVLSVAIAVSVPSVSTASMCRTIAFRRASRRAPRARVRARMIGISSGIIAKASARPVRINGRTSPSRSRHATMGTVRLIASAATSRDRLSSRMARSSGVGGGFASRARWARRPSSVASPVATTSASPRPRTTSVPEKATASASFSTGIDSPVRADSSTASP